MAEPCTCSQATAEPTCVVTAGAGITVAGSQISAHSAAAWTTFTPATTNFTLGNALNESRYLLVGKTLDVLYAIRFGTTSTYTATAWRLGLPAATVPFFGANTIASQHVHGFASMRDASAGTPWFSGEPTLDTNANPVRVRFGDDAVATNTNIAQGTPFTWTTSDELVIKMRFEVV